MVMLVLDTALGACSAALYDVPQARVLAARLALMERGHAEAIAPMVAGVLAEAGLAGSAITAVGVTRGPGTFTGVRIGLALAKGLALGRGVPLAAIDTLQATAAPHVGWQGAIVVAQWAGATGLLYSAVVDGRSGSVLRGPALHSAAEAAEGVPAGALVVGTAAGDVAPLLTAAHVAARHHLPEAALFAARVAAEPPRDSVTPLYLREPDAKRSAAEAAAVRVRSATVADAALLATLHGQCFAVGWTAESFTQALALPGAGALVVEDGGEAAGFVQFQTVAGEAEINTLCVVPLRRHVGHGSRLLQALEALLVAHGVSRLFLEVAADNQPALALYARHGFERSGLRKGYYARAGGTAIDAVCMQRSLAGAQG